MKEVANAARIGKVENEPSLAIFDDIFRNSFWDFYQQKICSIRWGFHHLGSYVGFSNFLSLPELYQLICQGEGWYFK